jgi:hypothetical protein
MNAMSVQAPTKHAAQLRRVTSREAPRTAAAVLCIGLLVALGAGCGGDSQAPTNPPPVPQPTQAQLSASGLAKLPVAPEGQRVDIDAPTFSDPTNVTNPLFPISDLHSAILNGHVDGKPFHTETTLLSETRIIEWPTGRPVETLVSQYVAFLDGRIEEVALDYYAQADDGSVWYFGEDVFNYNPDGTIADTDGTWLAGKEGPAAMIMPAAPEVGDVHRPENIPGLVFEEVAVKRVGKTVDGPAGPVDGAIVGEELHDDGSFSDKVFAPGYGEFFSAHEGDVEALALAVPTDALSDAPPAALRTLEAAAREAFDAIRSGQWKLASVTFGDLDAAWDRTQTGEVPARLAPPMQRALDRLGMAIDNRAEARAGAAAIDVSRATVDLKLRHVPPADVDLARFELWARQVLIDAEAGDAAGVAGDVATLEWVRDRFAHTLDPSARTRVDAHLLALRDSVVDEDLEAAADEASALRHTLADLS